MCGLVKLEGSICRMLLPRCSKPSVCGPCVLQPGMPGVCCSNWLFCLALVCPQLEVHVMHMLKQGALHTLLKAAEEGEL